MTIYVLCPSPVFKGGDIQSIADDYIKRLSDKVVIQKLSVKIKSNDSDDVVKSKQAEALDSALNKLPQNTYIIVLDERGKLLDSRQFATTLSNFKIQGLSDIAIVVGGAFGLTPTITNRAHLKLSLGSMVWPHRLVGVMILEQLYRAQQINAGHPYHKD